MVKSWRKTHVWLRVLRSCTRILQGSERNQKETTRRYKMKTFVMTMAIVLLAGTAYGVSYADLGGTAHGTDLHGVNEYFQQSGMSMNAGAPPPSDPIMEDSIVTGKLLDHPVDDMDDFNFEVGLPFSIRFDTNHDLVQFKDAYGLGGSNVFYDHSNTPYSTGIDSADYPPSPVQDGTQDIENLVNPPGEYSFRILTLNPNSGAPYGWGVDTWTLWIDVEDPPAPTIPEPAGLGLVGIALLGLRKRRS